MPEFSVIGHPLRRVDGEEELVGSTRYAGDLDLPGLLHARLVLSPHAHARIVRIDGKAALALPGVVAVLAARSRGGRRASAACRRSTAQTRQLDPALRSLGQHARPDPPVP